MVRITNTSKTIPIHVALCDISDCSNKKFCDTDPIIEPGNSMEYMTSSTGTIKICVWIDPQFTNQRSDHKLVWQGFVPITNNTIIFNPESCMLTCNGQCFPNEIENFDNLNLMLVKNPNQFNWWIWLVLFLVVMCIIIFIFISIYSKS